MGLIDGIEALYGGNVRLFPPYEGEGPAGMPEALLALLRRSDGVMETMRHPRTGETIDVGWVLYPCAMIVEETAFCCETYGTEGTAFADDGAGDLFLLKGDGTVACFDPIDGAESPAAGSLAEFYRVF